MVLTKPGSQIPLSYKYSRHSWDQSFASFSFSFLIYQYFLIDIFWPSQFVPFYGNFSFVFLSWSWSVFRWPLFCENFDLSLCKGIRNYFWMAIMIIKSKAWDFRRQSDLFSKESLKWPVKKNTLTNMKPFRGNILIRNWYNEVWFAPL